jgi:putative heme-binding domain-containing protein
VHYLIMLARLRGPRDEAVTRRTAGALLGLDGKYQRQQLSRDRHWPLRLVEVHAELARKDARLNQVVLDHAEFGRPDHALFTQAPGFDRRRAAELYLQRTEKDADYPWSPELVELLGQLPPERFLPIARRLWEQQGLRDALLVLLARQPQAGDRDRFLEGLRSPQLATIRRCLDALAKLPLPERGSEVLALIRCLRALPEGREESALRAQLADYLRKATGQDRLGADREAWTAWFGRTYPDLAVSLNNTDGVDLAAWTKRLARVDWSKGDRDRGRLVHVKAGCASCHSGGQALGPDLRGVTSRFSRDDLFTAIVQPSRDVPPRYQTTVILTTEGKVYQGSIIYEAVDGVILQTGPVATLRIAGDRIASQRSLPVSLMPAGLLDPLQDQEIADLYAWLRSQAGPSPRRRRSRNANALRERYRG